MLRGWGKGKVCLALISFLFNIVAFIDRTVNSSEEGSN